MSSTAENIWGYSSSQTMRCHFKKLENSHSGVYYQKCCMQDKGGNYSALLVTSEILVPALGTALKKHRHREYPTESEKNKVFQKPESLKKNCLDDKKGG